VDRIETKDDVPGGIDEALGQLPAHEVARLRYCFDNGTAAFAKLKCGLYVGCHMDQLSHVERIITEGKWSLCRKLGS